LCVRIAAAQAEAESLGKSRGALGGIVLGGIVAATIDIGAACLITGRSVIFILHTIAGGLLGKASYSGGMRTALFGLVLQELMGVIIAAIYAAAARVMPPLRRHWIAGGLAYGVIIFFVMNYVVVPLSAWKHVPHFTAPKFLANLAAMLLFGLIVAFFVRRVSR
jgi:outer membrane lipoprotein SlyB